MVPKLTSLTIAGVLLSALQTGGPDQGSSAEKTISQIVEQSAKAVVLVTNLDRRGKIRGLGSGFLVKPDGVFITSHHVVEGAAGIAVKLSDGREFEVTGYVALKPDDDLAVLKIDAKDLPIVSLGESAAVKVGAHVVAIGSPLGLENTVSDGIVSSVREIEGGRLFQTTAPISPGNSGGPLFDMSGKVIGVTFAQVKDGQNLNFAIPSSYVEPLLRQIRVRRFASVAGTQKSETCPVVGNRTSGIYHVPGGQFYTQMLSSENRVCFGNEDEALQAGFRRSLR